MTERQKPHRSTDIARNFTEASFLKTCARDWVNPFLSRNVPIEALRGLLLDVFERMAGVALTPEQRTLALSRMSAQQVLVMPLETVQTLWEEEPSLKPFCDGLAIALEVAAEVMPSPPQELWVQAAPH